MTYQENNPIYALNSYTWKVLQTNLGWNKANFDGAVPIIPSAQQPEFVDSGHAFVVYGSALLPTKHLYVWNEASIAYNVYAATSTEVNKTIDLLVEAFKRQDDTAADINQWLDIEGKARGSYRGVYFTSTNIDMTERAEPADQEGGLVTGYVLINIRYVQSDTGAQFNNFVFD